MPKFIERYGVMEDFEARTRSNLLDMAFNPAGGELASKVNYFEVDVNRITPRSINQYSQARIDRLARSIEATNNRLIHPIVLVKASDLPEDGEVIKEYIKHGIDPATLDLVIVAGERRFRAWMLLREREAERIKDEIGTSNRFDTITANILTAKEAKNEKVYYEDSNNEARQLSPLDVVRLCNNAKAEVDTPEKKRAALIEMAEGNEENIPKDPKEAEKLFNMEKYCKFYIENDIGLDGFNGGSIKNVNAILAKCEPDVIEALQAGKINTYNAHMLRNEAPEKQREAINVLETEGKGAFTKIILGIKEKEKKEKERKKRKKTSKYSSASANKQTRKIIKDVEPDLDLLREMVSSLGGENRAVYDKIVKSFDRCRKEIEGYLDQLG